MVLPVDDIELAVFQTDGADANMPDLDEPVLRTREPDLIVPQADIGGLTFTERLNDRKDEGSFMLYNDDGQYTDAVTSGDRIEIRVQYAIPEVESWGDGAWGENAWGGDRVVWTCWVRDRTFEMHGGDHHRLLIDGEDFVFGLIGTRFADVQFDGKQIPGALSEVLTSNAPETRLGVDNSITDEIEVTFSGTDLMEAVNTLFSHGDLIGRGYSDLITTTRLDDVSPKFDAVDDEIGVLDVEESDNGLVNYARVDGGTDEALDSDATLTGQDSYFTIDEDSPRWYFQIPVRKSTIARLAFWTKKQSEENLIVRLQKGNSADSGPINMDSDQSDIARRNQSHEFIAEEGWTEFIMPSHTLPEPHPWVIVESRGEGHRMGLNHEGRVIRRVWYPYNVVTRQRDSVSMSEFRRREARITDDTISTYDEGRKLAAAHVRHNSSPEYVVQTRAESLRMHMLRPGEAIGLQYPEVATLGDYLVTERTADYDGNSLHTDLTLQAISSM